MSGRAGTVKGRYWGAGGALAGTNGPYSGHNKNLKSVFKVRAYRQSRSTR